MTSAVSVMGMCGGPVMSPRQQDQKLEIVGMIAAIVLEKKNPDPRDAKFFQLTKDNSLCIDSRQISTFVRDLELLNSQTINK